MKRFFTPDGLHLLESFCFTRTLFAFDFDGTLSPIVRDPAKATMTKSTSSLLMELNGLAPVAVLSGRALKDLKARLGCKPRYLVGNHGLEGLKPGASTLAQANATTAAWKKTLGHRLERDPGIRLEDKGYSLAIHYRLSRRKTAARDEALRAAAELVPPPRLIPGKCVINLVPPGAPHKGMALLELMKDCGAKAACYLGDDATDEDVFALPDARLLSIRIGKKISSAANYYVERQSETNRVMQYMVRYLKG